MSRRPPQKVTCRHCQKPFMAAAWRVTANQRYCSSECLLGTADASITPGWKRIPGFPAYEAHPDGTVRRIGEIAARKPQTHGRRYSSIWLATADGSGATVGLHRIICQTFHGAPPTAKHHAAHLDGDRFRNCAANLRWKTAVENEADKLLHDTHTRGGRNGRAIFDEAAVREIRVRFAGARSREEVGNLRAYFAREYGTSRSAVTNVYRGLCWKWLEG